MASPTLSDRIEKQVTLRAPRSRVWRALADTREFGEWFGFALEGPFVAGKAIRGSFTGKIDEAGLEAYQKSLGLVPTKVKLPDKNFTFCVVERIEPERYLSFRWTPYGIDADADPEHEPMTLVEFQLEDAPEGTLLTIVESGFDQVPARRRERAFFMNQGGWQAQAENIKKYVESA